MLSLLPIAQALGGLAPRTATIGVGLVVYVFGILSLSRCTAAGFWSPVTLFLVVVGVFHLGLAANMLLDIDPALPRANDYDWYLGRAGVFSIYLTTIGICGYVLVSLIALARRPSFSTVTADDEARRLHLSRAGTAVLFFGVVVWFVLAISQVGIAGLFGSYQDFLSATRSTDIDLTYLVIGVGLGMTVMAPVRGLAVPTLVLFALYAAIGFFLGLRGEVLFPISVAAAVLAHRRRMPNALFVVAGGLLLLMFVNAAKQIRQVGVSEAGLDLSSASPLAALAELGSTIRVVATVVDWHAAGDSFRMGETYTVSVARAIEQIAGERVPAGQDTRLFNVEILNRAGGIGGSVIGEAYHNFSVAGVVVVMMVLGALFAHFSREYLTPTQTATYVVVAMPLFNHIRNSFVPVLPAMAIGLIFVAIVVATGRRRKTRAREIGASSESHISTPP